MNGLWQRAADRMREELGEFLQRVGNFPRLIERNACLERCKTSGCEPGLDAVVERLAEQREVEEGRCRRVRLKPSQAPAPPPRASRERRYEIGPGSFARSGSRELPYRSFAQAVRQHSKREQGFEGGSAEDAFR